jgi:hypothetical protein
MWRVVEAYIEWGSDHDINAIALNDFDSAEITTISKLVNERFCRTDMDNPGNRELVRLCIIKTTKCKNNELNYFRQDSRFGEEIKEFMKGEMRVLTLFNLSVSVLRCQHCRISITSLLMGLQNPVVQPKTLKTSSLRTLIFQYGV